MPIDSHSYLVAQGWTGKGTGLRKGAISRPLAIPQKKNLAGLGKDRDEAFPFWDHLFSVAAKSIQLKFTSDNEDEANMGSSTPTVKHTATGILSNRRPVVGNLATSPDPDNKIQRSSLITVAKREAAKRRLYAKFFRGPVLGPDNHSDGEKGDLKNGCISSEATTAEIGYRPKKRKESEDCDDERRRKKRKRELKKSMKEWKRMKEMQITEIDKMDDLEALKREDKKARKRERMKEMQITEVDKTDDLEALKREDKKARKRERKEAKGRLSQVGRVNMKSKGDDDSKWNEKNPILSKKQRDTHTPTEGDQDQSRKKKNRDGSVEEVMI